MGGAGRPVLRGRAGPMHLDITLQEAKELQFILAGEIIRGQDRLKAGVVDDFTAAGILSRRRTCERLLAKMLAKGFF